MNPTSSTSTNDLAQKYYQQGFTAGRAAGYRRGLLSTPRYLIGGNGQKDTILPYHFSEQMIQALTLLFQRAHEIKQLNDDSPSEEYRAHIQDFQKGWDVGEKQGCKEAFTDAFDTIPGFKKGYELQQAKRWLNQAINIWRGYQIPDDAIECAPFIQSLKDEVIQAEERLRDMGPDFQIGVPLGIQIADSVDQEHPPYPFSYESQRNTEKAFRQRAFQEARQTSLGRDNYQRAHLIGSLQGRIDGFENGWRTHHGKFEETLQEIPEGLKKEMEAAREKLAPCIKNIRESIPSTITETKAWQDTVQSASRGDTYQSAFDSAAQIYLNQAAEKKLRPAPHPLLWYESDSLFKGSPLSISGPGGT